MQELLNVNADSQTVSARELHKQLNIETPFKKWIDRMIEYGFEEEKDFWTKMSKTSEQGGRPATEYDITLDMAKQICMIQRTPEGKAVRQYLIDLEKAWNSPEQVFARALKMADATIAKLKGEKIDYIRHMEYLRKNEVMLSELSQKELDQLAIHDEYDLESYKFQVLNYDIEVKDALIAEALTSLTKRKRDVILLSYFMGMSDA